MPQPPSSAREGGLAAGFRLAGCRIRPELNRLDRDGETVYLTPKAMAVLLHLAHRPRRLVTKEALLDAVWSDAFVGEEVLTQAIYEVRKALGDDARRPRFIETIHRKGYRLIADVQADEASAGRGPGHDPRSPRWRAWLGAVTGIGALSLIYFLAKALSDTPVPSDPPDAPDLPDCAVRFQANSLGTVDDRLIESLRRRCPALLPRDEADLVPAGLVELTLTLRHGMLEMVARSPVLAEAISHRGSSDQIDFLIWDFVPLVLHTLAEASMERKPSPTYQETSARSTLAYSQGRAARRARQIEEAIENYRDAIRIRGDNVSAGASLANALQILGLEDEALIVLEETIEIVDATDPEDSNVRRMLERWQAQARGDYGREKELLEALVTDHPKDPGHLQRLAWFLYVHTDDCRRAIGFLERAQASDERPERYSYLGDAFLACEDLGPARAAYEKRCELSPEDSGAWTALAEFQILVGDYLGADRSLAAIAEIGNLDRQAELLRGELQRRQGRFAKAKSHLETYGLLYPNEIALSKSRLAALYLSWDRVGEARKEAASLLELEPSSVLTQAAVGMIELRNGDFEAVREGLEEIRPHIEDTHFRAEHFHYLGGELARAEGRLDDAASSFRAALELGTPIDRAWIGRALAETLADAGDVAGACDAFSDALAFNPCHAESLCALGELLEANRETSEARAAFDRCWEVVAEGDRDVPLVRRARQGRRELEGVAPHEGALCRERVALGSCG